MVSYIPNIANAVLSFRVSHKLELTSYREVLDLIDIVAHHIPARPSSDAILSFNQTTCYRDKCLLICHEQRCQTGSPAARQDFDSSTAGESDHCSRIAFCDNRFSRDHNKTNRACSRCQQGTAFQALPSKHALYSALLSEKTHYSGLQESLEEAAAKPEDKRLFMLLPAIESEREQTQYCFVYSCSVG
jgi:hypothetical protein